MSITDDNNIKGCSMRAFFGLAPDAKTKLAIENWRHKALPHFDGAVPAANFHLTLAFLGQITLKQLAVLCEGAEQLSQLQSFEVHLNYVGYWSRPKALWLGCEDVEEPHRQLVKKLTVLANGAGLQLPKQDYVAHLTLARKCSTNPPAPLLAPNFAWKNTEFHLYQSVSGKQGVTYQIRRSWPLLHNQRF